MAALAVGSVIIALVASELFAGLHFSREVRPLVYDMAVGFFVSYLFFLIVVEIPALLVRRRIARLLKKHFRSFKLSCIELYLSAIGDSWESELPEQLLDPNTFSEYFSERHSPSQNRWHAVHNGLYDYGVPQLIVECELLAREIEYALVKLDVDDADVEASLRRLSRSLLRLKNREANYDDVKALLNFLYPIHSHWSWLDGHAGKDPIGDLINGL